MMDTYSARVQREGSLWLIRVPEVDREAQARTLREVEAMARDLVAVVREVDPASFDLVVELDLPGEVQDHLHEAKRLRASAAEAISAAARESRAAARSLASRNIPLRDIRLALGSHQRAAQLLNDEQPSAR
ncbi:hypothetical protein H9L10_11715 [Phycicoccus endophyticus]|uniref:HicB family protein n=1 Tax=Phycicoccus endophyticus TaxID=1690220 RepID=A0A7G9R005_9MICO|nr:hypothetical protein [Phycicoccus endophyticus]NHI20790.1 hypothetical protein [Phycicoccus endophyticus]QNN48930.1 hypothetical protein H9L10_11715 [Phycicoccus endophyticus]